MASHVIPAVAFPFNIAPRAAQRLVLEQLKTKTYTLNLQRVEPPKSHIQGRRHCGVAPALPSHSSRFDEYLSHSARWWWLKERMDLHHVVSVGELAGHTVYLSPTIADLCMLEGDALPLEEQPFRIAVHLNDLVIEKLSDDPPDSVYFDGEDSDRADAYLDAVVVKLAKEHRRREQQPPAATTPEADPERRTVAPRSTYFDPFVLFERARSVAIGDENEPEISVPIAVVPSLEFEEGAHGEDAPSRPESPRWGVQEPTQAKAPPALTTADDDDPFPITPTLVSAQQLAPSTSGAHPAHQEICDTPKADQGPISKPLSSQPAG